MHTGQPATLILTLRLDADSQSYFNTQRRLYFPPGRNVLDAHLTLFHQLPVGPETREKLSAIQYSQFSLRVAGLISLGGGVAYHLESDMLLKLHQNLKLLFAGQLIPQDRQPLRPHVTVQNKVKPEEARQLLNTLQDTFEPFTVQALGLDLWTYLGGPWRYEQTWYFEATN